MRKRWADLLLALLAALLLTAGCGAKGGSGVSLTVMGKSSDLNKSYMRSIFALYEKTTGNKLEIRAFEDSEYEQKAAEAFQSGNAPDLFMHFHNADLSRFDVAENFLYLNGEDWVDDLTDSAKAYCTDGDGNLLGLPFWESSVSGCYYNKTILDSLGMKPATTQAEFDVLCQVLAETGYTPICWPGNGCAWMPQFGLDPIFADDPEMLEKINRNEITYGEIPAVTDMVRWIGNAAKAGWFGPDYRSCGWSDIGHALSSGDAVMTFIWDTWFYTDFKADGEYTVEDFALMPVFMNTAAEGSFEGGNLNMMMVNRNGDKVDAALEFLAFCATPENYNAAFDGISTVSCFKGQNTNIQSKMVTDARASVSEKERVSTAASRIVGYSGDDVVAALDRLFSGETDVEGCVRLMDESRIAAASAQGADGFPGA